LGTCLELFFKCFRFHTEDVRTYKYLFKTLY
jgi:hypothetical protein